MKKLISSLVVVMFTTLTFQAQKKNNVGELTETSTNDSHIFKLFPTQNMWTFIKLNTRNGQITQVQYDLQSNNRSETFLSSQNLIDIEKEVNGRFTLYPTQNIYTFILLDQIDGRIWQMQWSFEAEKRFIIPIGN